MSLPIQGSELEDQSKLIPLKFKAVKIFESNESVIYRVSETNGHLLPLGIETAIHSLVEIRQSGTFIIDPGPHPRYASKLIRSIENQHNKKLPPVKWIFNSTGKPENVLGNAFFANLSPLFISSKTTADVMKAKCEKCRRDLLSAIPEKGLLKEKIIHPSYYVDNRQVLHPQLSDWITYTFDCAKNSGDTVLWNEKASVLYAGRMVHTRNIPSLLHANTTEWVRALKVLSNLKPKYVIGSGAIGSLNAFDSKDILLTKNYLSTLLKVVELDFNSGGNGSDADQRLNLTEYDHLKGYSQRHGLNIQHAWRELELKDFGGEQLCAKESLFDKYDANINNTVFKEYENKKSGFDMNEISKGTYVFTGKVEDFSKTNSGNVSNFGFVVGKDCVAVVDTGGSSTTGRVLLSSIREVTDTPICFIVNTHAHPDHIGGNSVFANLNPKPEFITHKKFQRALASRSGVFNKRLEELMGEKDTIKPVQTSKEINNTFELNLGGRTLFLKAWKTSHTDNDLTVYDENGKVFWSGDLLFVDHIPVLDGNLINWIKVTKEITRKSHSGSNGSNVKFIVPGHGEVQGIGSKKLKKQEKYLTRLKKLTRIAIRNKVPIGKAVKNIAADINGTWLLSDLFNRRNATAAYAELEWED